MNVAQSDAAVTTGARNVRHRRRITPGVTKLMYAAQQGKVEKLKGILKNTQPSTIYGRDRTGKTALHYCCTSDSICAAQAADLLVMAAPDLIETHDEDGFTPLHLAVIAGNMQLVTFLLANKADVHAVDNEKHTVVHWATVCGETAALRSVLAAGAPVSTPDVHGGYPLHYAAQMCGGERDSALGMQVLQTLLSHPDISVTVMDGDKRQPLLWAASAGSAKALLALIRAGAAIESSDKDGLTALHCAASRGHTDCIDTLLTLCGASPDVIDSNGCTALHYAVTLGHADATALLLAHGADPNRQDRKGRTPAHCGCAKGQFETVKLIGSHGANLWLKNAKGDLPLHEAAASGRRELVKWLLEMRPSQVNSRNNDGRCPLHMAALNDNSDMCKILIDAGAQINPILRTSKNIFMTPLDCALQRGFRSTAKYLQLHGGVPASRLGDNRANTTNSAVSLQIRDDVTFWGDTSSDSETETKTERLSKKTYRKKLAYRKQTSISGSDIETHQKPKRPKRKSYERSKSRKTSSTTTEIIPNDSKKNSSLKSSSRMDYSNEIIINGKTEINIIQRKEISVNAENDIYDKTVTTLSIPTESEITTEKEKRPRSAKYSILREKTVSSEKTPLDVANSMEEKLSKLQEKRSSLSIKDQSTNTSEETPETIIDNFKSKIEREKAVQEDTLSQSLPDQQSLLSNTSEDIEMHKQVIVEAAIHSPPKDKKNESNENREDGEDKKEREETSEEGKPMKQKSFESKTEEETIRREQESTMKSGAKVIKIEENVSKTEETFTEKKEIKTEETITKKEVINSTETVKSKEFSDKESDDIETLGKKIDSKSHVKLSEESKTLDKKSDDGKLPKQISDEVMTPEQKSDADRAPDQKSGKIFTEVDKHDSNIDVVCSTPSFQVISESPRSQPDDVFGETVVEDSIKIKKTTKFDESTIAESSKDHKKNRKKAKLEKSEEDLSSGMSSDSSSSKKPHKSFQVLDNIDKDARRSKRSAEKKGSRSRSEELSKEKTSKLKKSKIPTPLYPTKLSKSDKSIDRLGQTDQSLPYLPNVEERRRRLRQTSRSESNLANSIYSDNERGSQSDIDNENKLSLVKRKKMRRRIRARESKSAGSDYESSNLIDSGFEPSPRSTRIPKWRNMSDRGVNMTSVTQTIQSNIRRYHLERKIFQHLLELKRLQIRSNQNNETMLVKRAIDQYHQSCAATVGAGRYIAEDFSFKSFEKFLYESLRKLQKTGIEHLKGLPETPIHPLHCTQSTNRCMHTAHAYTGVPCAAYLPRMDHHSIPKVGFASCKPGTGFLPMIHPKKAVTLELSHGPDKQIISLPTDRLDQNKRYYVTFTVKGRDSNSPPEENGVLAHRHAKSD